MAFKFSLGSVLRVRGIVEEREERMLQSIQLELSRAQESLARTEAEIEGSDASRQAEVFKAFLGHNLHASYGEVKQLKETREVLVERIEKLKQLRDRQVVVYQQARRNREMLTDMREEKRSEYDSDVARDAQKTLDDNYIARRGRF
jgi:flagellar export protein FliJ